jgi:hypothetical protein
MLNATQLKASLENFVASETVRYSPTQILDLTGLEVSFPLTGEELSDYVYNKLESLLGESILEEIQVVTPVTAKDQAPIPVVNNNFDTTLPSMNAIRSRYMEGKEAGFLSANNLKVNYRIAIKSRDEAKLLSQQAKVLSMLEEAGFNHRPTLESYNNSVDYLLSSMVLHSRKNQWTRISLTESSYTNSKMSYTAVKKLISALEESGQIEVIKGFNAREGFKQGRSTCVRFHDESPIYSYVCSMVAKDELRFNLDNKYVVLVRDNRRRVSLVEGDKVPANTTRLFELYKAAADNTTVSIATSVTQDPNVTFLPQMEYKNGNKGYNLSQLLPIHQVFNNKALTTGGRYYCGISNLKKETRSQILFNGQRTSEVDFRSCHLSILATMSNKTVGYDPYTFGKITSRETNKLLCLIAINCKSQHQLNTALDSKIKELGLEITKEDWLRVVSERHPWLVQYIGTNAGLRLQAIESTIVTRAMVRFMEQTKSLAISLHDGLLVSKKYATLAANCMMDSYEAQFPLTSKAVIGDNCVVTCDGHAYHAFSERND